MNEQLPSRRRRRRRRRATPLAAIALLLGIFAAVSVVPAWTAYTAARSGQKHLESARDRLLRSNLSASAADLDAAELDLRAARADFQRARSMIALHPLLPVLSLMPRVKTQVRATNLLLDAGIAGVDFGRAVVAIGRMRLESPDQPGSTALIERVQRWLQQTSPQAQQMEDAAGRLRQAYLELAPAQLVPPLARARDSLGREVPHVERIAGQWTAARQLLPRLLAFQGTRSYLVLALNEGELLPGGGLVTAVGRLSLKDGKVEDLTMQDSIRFGNEWQARNPHYVPPPPPLKHYLLRDVTWNITVALWSPDFPTNAQRAVEFWKLGGGAPIDGVLAVDLTALQELLTLTGPIHLDTYDVTLNTSNVVLELERLTRQPFDPLSSDRKAIVADLARILIPKLLATPTDRWDEMALTLAKLVSGRHLMVWSPQPEEQHNLTLLGLDGGVRELPTDFLMLVDGSVQSTKLNLVITPQLSIDVALRASGGADHTVEVHYRNDLPTWAQDKDPALVQQLMLSGVYGNYARLYVTRGSQLHSLAVDGREVGAEAVEDELGKRVFGRFLSAAPGETKTLAYRYYSPGVLYSSASGAVYALYVQKQPGAIAMPVTVRVQPPAGYVVRSLTANGQAGAGNEIRVRLDQDVLILAKLEGKPGDRASAAESSLLKR